MDIEFFGVELSEKLLQKYILVAKRNLGVNVAKKHEYCRIGKKDTWSQVKWAFYYTFLEVCQTDTLWIVAFIPWSIAWATIPECICNPIIRKWVFRQCLPFSWTTLRGKHCRHHIAVMGVVDIVHTKRHQLFSQM